LVYSTCTIEPEENEEMVKAFVKNNSEFEIVDISSLLPQNIVTETAKDGFIQLYPNIQGIDGFFIARMRRRS
jgi:16S rRNA (cytosine967-C5)-methyltransferase